MKSLFGFALVMCTGIAFAATPLAVWDGDFGTTTKGDFTLDAKGNSTSSGSLVIDQAVGAVFTGSDSSLNNCTIIIKGSNLNLSSENAQYLFAAHENALSDDKQYNKIGCSLAADNGGVKGIWENGLYTVNASTSEALSKPDATIVVNIQRSVGTYVYEIITGEDGVKTCKEVYKSTSLKSSSSNYKGFALGGVYEKTSAALAPATGWTIEGVAVFGETLTQNEILGYCFPSDEIVYTATVNGQSVAWDVELPETLDPDAVVRYVGSGSVTLGRDITARIEIGSGVTLTPPADGVTGRISILEGGVLNLASGAWLSQTKISNHGTIAVTGGTVDNPVVINDNGAADTGVGAVTIAAGAVLKNIASNGNKVYKVTGAGADSTFIMSSNRDWGMTDGTQIRACTVIVQDKEFWLERSTAYDSTVNLVLNQKLHLGNPDTTFSIGSLSGGGDIVLNGPMTTLSLNMNAASEYSGSCAATLQINGANPFFLKASAFTGSVVVGEGASVVFDPGADTILTVASVTTPEETGAVSVASGTVDFGTNRPRIGTIAGLAAFTATTEELSAGNITLATTQEIYSEGTIAVVDPSETLLTISVSVVDSVLTLAFDEVKPFTGNTKTSEWSENLTGLVLVQNASESALTLEVDSAFPANVTELNVFGKVVIDASPDLDGFGASVVLNIAEGAEVTVKGAWPFTGIKGAGDLVMDFEGTSATIPGDNSAFTGASTIAAGTVKMGHFNCFGPWGRTILVKTGATVDSNGIGNNGVWSGNTYILNLEEGAKYTNSREPSTDIKLAFPVCKVVLLGNATIEAKDYACGLTKHYHYGTTVDVGDYTLTATGGKTIWFSDCLFTGSGTFSVIDGTVVRLARNYFNNNIRSECEISVEEGSQIILDNYGNGAPTFTINNAIIVDGALNSAHGNGSYVVNSSLSGSGTINAAMTLGADAVIKPNGAGCPTFSVAPTSERDGGQIAVDTTGIDLVVATRIKILRVTDASLLPSLDLVAGVPKGWVVEKSADGLGVNFVKPQFYIIIR